MKKMGEMEGETALIVVLVVGWGVSISVLINLLVGRLLWGFVRGFSMWFFKKSENFIEKIYDLI